MGSDSWKNDAAFEWALSAGELPYPHAPSDEYSYKKLSTKVYAYALKKGEVYIRPHGTSPVIALSDFNECNGKITVQYFTGGIDDIKPDFMWATERKGNVAKTNEKENDMTNTNKLYQIVGTETYGTHIATNSKGAYVLEMKGSGEVVTKLKKELEEVVPYTISLKFLSGGYGQEYAYFSKEGDVRVGDLVNVGSGMAMITAVNTRSSKATKDLEGYVVVTKKIGE